MPYIGYLLIIPAQAGIQSRGSLPVSINLTGNGTSLMGSQNQSAQPFVVPSRKATRYSLKHIPWSPNTKRSYVSDWKNFTIPCLENRCAGVPAAPADVGRHPGHLVKTEGRTLATARMHLAAVAAAHRLDGHLNTVARPLVKATMKRLAREYGWPRKQARGLTSEAQPRSRPPRASNGFARESAGAGQPRPRLLGGPRLT